MSTGKVQAILEQVGQMDTGTASPQEGYRKIAKVLKLPSCNGCPYLKFHLYPGKDDLTGKYTCEASHAKTVITKFVMTATKSPSCPFVRLSRMMSEAHKEVRRELSQVFTAEQAEQMLTSQEPKP